MSYYKLRSVKFNEKNNSINIDIADSSLRPLKFMKSEYAAETDMNFNDKLSAFLVSCMEGNFHPYESCSITPILKEMESYKKIAENIVVNATGTSFIVNCWDYKLPDYNILKKYLAKEVGIKMVKKIPFSEQEIKDTMKRMAREAVDKIEKEKKKDTEARKFRISSAVTSDIMDNWDVLVSVDEELILAPQQNYKPGILDNQSKTAIFLGKNSDLWWFFEGTYSNRERNMLIRENEVMEEKLIRFEKLVKENNIVFSKLPYKGFEEEPEQETSLSIYEIIDNMIDELERAKELLADSKEAEDSMLLSDIESELERSADIKDRITFSMMLAANVGDSSLSTISEIFKLENKTDLPYIEGKSDEKETYDFINSITMKIKDKKENR